jgi:predicted negative regulator of RcsB-dependent stress response
MTEYMTDEEQVERIKKWWSDNGGAVIAGLVIGIGGLAGWRFYTDYKANQAAEASAHFSQMISALDSSQADQAIEQANVVLNDYSSTPYAQLAQLALAKAYVSSEKYEQAAQTLQKLVDESTEPSLQTIARLRLAEVQLQLGQPDQALQTIDVAHPQQFNAAAEELKGDILASQGQKEQAREAYQKARMANPPAANPNFLRQKLDNLGVSTTMQG